MRQQASLSHHSKHVPAAGFTAVELMISLAIVSILTAIAIPNLKDLYYRNMARDAIFRITHLVSRARSEAVTKALTTTLCPSTDGRQCSGNWQDGVLLFTDKNSNRKLDPDDEVLRFQSPFIEQGKLQWNSLGNTLQFSSIGMPRGTVGSFIYCPAENRPEFGKASVLSFQGKLRKGTDSNKDGIDETSKGNNIRC